MKKYGLPTLVCGIILTVSAPGGMAAETAAAAANPPAAAQADANNARTANSVPSAPSTLPPPEALTPRMRLICGLAENKGYLLRFRAIHALGSSMGDAEKAALLAFLYQKPATESLQLLEFDSLKNDAVYALLNQPGAPGDLHRHLVAMYYDTSFDVVWRDYCIQFLGRIYPKVRDPRDAAAIRDLFQHALMRRKNSFVGTALIALKDLSALPEFKPDVIASSAMEVLRNEETMADAKITALQVATILKHPEALAEARKLLAAADTAVPLKMSAIATLGRLGSPSRDDETLRKYTIHRASAPESFIC